MAASGSTSGGVSAIGAIGSGASGGAVGAVTATTRLQPVLRDLPGLVPGSVLRLAGGPMPGAPEAGWRLESLDSGQVLTLIEPPLDDLQPGDQLLLRVRTVSPRLELEVMERRAAGESVSRAWTSSGAGNGGNGSGVAPSAWGQLSALRADLAQWRRQLLSTPMLEAASVRTPAALVSAWTIALAHGQVPAGPTGEPLWLLPLPYWVRVDRPTTPSADRHPPEEGASSSPGGALPDDEPALSVLLRWRGEAVALQLQGSRAALAITVLAEHEAVLTALRAELPRVLAALVRAGFRLKRLSWRRQPLWVPVDPFPPMRSAPDLLAAAAELVAALA